MNLDIDNCYAHEFENGDYRKVMVNYDNLSVLLQTNDSIIVYLFKVYPKDNVYTYKLFKGVYLDKFYSRELIISGEFFCINLDISDWMDCIANNLLKEEDLSFPVSFMTSSGAYNKDMSCYYTQSKVH